MKDPLDPLDPRDICFKGLKLLRSNFDQSEDITILEVRNRTYCYGDVVNYLLPRDCSVYLPLEHKFYTRYVIKDSRMSCGWDKIVEFYLEPVMRELTEAILQVNVGNVMFAPLCTIPSSTGANSFVGTYDNICLRCTANYDETEQGMVFVCNVLLATVDFDNCDIQEPKVPAITCGRCEH